MAIVRTDDKHYKAIADAIRNQPGYTDNYTPEQMPSAIISAIIDANAEGMGAGYDDGYTLGKQAQYDEFWDAIQDGGNRVDYQMAFRRSRWNSDTFKPKYNISPTSAQELFRTTTVGDDTTKRIDLIKLEEETGFKFDFSNCTNMAFAFADSGCILTIGEVDLRKCTIGESLNYTFYGGYGGSAKTEIKKIICDENTFFHSTTFDYLPWLQEIRFEGTIGKTGIIFSRSTRLSHESLFGAIATEEQIAAGKNLATIDGVTYYGGIITALQDLNGAGTTKTLTLGTENLAKLTDTEKAIATQKGWTLA